MTRTARSAGPDTASDARQSRFPIRYDGYAKTRDFGTFTARSFRHVDAYLIGVHDDRQPLIDMTPWMPEPDFKGIHREIVENWGERSGVAYPCNPVAGEQPPDLADGRYHIDELYFHLDEDADAALIERLRAAGDYWQRQLTLRRDCADRLIEWGVLHELKYPGTDWNLAALRRFPRLIAYLHTVPMQIERAYFLIYRPGEQTSIHRDDVEIKQARPWHGCLLNFQNRPHPTFVYDPKLRRRVGCPGWATSFNFCDYHGGRVRPDLSYTVRIDGWFDGIAGFRHGVPVWDGDWDRARTTPNPHLT